MSLRLLAGTVAIGVAVTGSVATLPTSDAAPPPAAKDGKQRDWTEADKTGFGTSRTRASNVWFTLQGGRTSEVFYPDLSTPSVRSLEIRVTDSDRTFTDGPADMNTTVERPDPRSLRFVQTHTDKDGKYQLTATHVTDPRRDAYVVRLALESLDDGHYSMRVVYDPALANDGSDDRGSTRGNALIATDDRVSTALVAHPTLKDLSTSNGPGDVVQRARIQGQNATLTLGFGRSAAARSTRPSAARPGDTPTPRRRTTPAGTATSTS